MKVLYIVLLVAGLLMTTSAMSDVTVLVTRHRWHTGIVVPAGQLPEELSFLEAHFDDPAWYEFGWGDSEFYRHEERYWLMARAILWPTDAILHVVDFRYAPSREIPGLEVEALCLSHEQLERLLRALAQDFAKRGSKPEPVAIGLYGDSLFFPARGSFWFMRTCNTWTAERLRQAGIDLRVFMMLTAGSLMAQVRESDQAGACRER